MTPESLEVRRKRLRFRAWHRGMRESDLLLGNFADAHAGGFDEAQLDRFETLLEVADADIYNWYAGREPVPPEYNHDVMALLQAFRIVDTAQN
ncbi:MAG: succinate dehydrogenase assembly factor 2 [Rhodospirillaceae bacterium]